MYVGNLDWSVDWKALKDHMSQVGVVEYAEVLKRSDGKSKGGGLVRYSNAASARRAIKELTDTEIQSRPIFVREDREAGKTSGGGASGGGRQKMASGGANTVFVGNLEFSTSWQELKDYMAKAGSVEFAEIIKNSSGRPSGGGLVRFASADAASRAISELTDTKLKGRSIFVREDRESKKQSNRPARQSTRQTARPAGEISVFVGNIPWTADWRIIKVPQACLYYAHTFCPASPPENRSPDPFPFPQTPSRTCSPIMA